MRTIALSAAAALVAACATTPLSNPALEEAQATYKAAASDPKVNTHARMELTRAETTLRDAEAEFKRGGDPASVAHLAYLAKQRALIAEERAELATAEETIGNANAQRDRVMLDARTRALQTQQQQTASAEQRAKAAEQQAMSVEQRAAAAEQHARAAQEDLRKAQDEARIASQRADQYRSELQELQAKQTPHGMVVTLGDVLFDVGKATLKPGAARAIDRLAEFLKQHGERKVRIEGFTDSTGSEETNQRLSEQRANAVRSALLERGVAPERIEAVGFGQGFPVATNDTQAGRQQNRRVEIVIQ
jgi:outer membrane protein OmpA-like peptidoglycan-associated protein